MSSAMSEAELLAAVLDLAKLNHVRTAHFRPGRTEQGWRTPVQGDAAGWPDLVLVGSARAMVVELKSATGRPTPEQLHWLSDFDRVGIPVAIWRPVQLRDGTIQRALRALNGKGNDHERGTEAPTPARRRHVGIDRRTNPERSSAPR